MFVKEVTCTGTTKERHDLGSGDAVVSINSIAQATISALTKSFVSADLDDRN